MSNLTVRIITGTTNLRDQSSKCYLYVTPAAGSPAQGRKESTIGAMASISAVNGLHKLNMNQRDSVTGYPSDIGGQMTEAQYLIPEGLIAKVFAKVHSANGMVFTGTLYLKFRSAAPLHRVVIRQTRSNEVAHQGGLIEGRFDILTAAQCDQIACIEEKYRHMYRNAATREHLFTAEELAAAKATVAVVTTATGTTVEVETEVRKRRFKL